VCYVHNLYRPDSDGVSVSFNPASSFFLSNEASATLLWIKIPPKFSTKTIR
jgi:hypothetical protein